MARAREVAAGTCMGKTRSGGSVLHVTRVLPRTGWGSRATRYDSSRCVPHSKGYAQGIGRRRASSPAFAFPSDATRARFPRSRLYGARTCLTWFAWQRPPLQDEGQSFAFGTLSAVILLAMIPTVIVFVLLQRHYVRGVSEGAFAGF